MFVEPKNKLNAVIIVTLPFFHPFSRKKQQKSITASPLCTRKTKRKFDTSDLAYCGKKSAKQNNTNKISHIFSICNFRAKTCNYAANNLSFFVCFGQNLVIKIIKSSRLLLLNPYSNFPPNLALIRTRNGFLIPCQVEQGKEISYLAKINPSTKKKTMTSSRHPINGIEEKRWFSFVSLFRNFRIFDSFEHAF